MIHALTSMLAAYVYHYRPFNDPLPIWTDARWPWLLLPLCIAVAVVYKSIRCKSMRRVPREAAGLVIVIILGMAAAAVALALVVRGLER
ncbi:MAG TPA: hypothetical protein VFC78_02515 [Tepidisphaeraceae bacterium]|nr:hypothetical protein [Tepidisphaeraceae bacterium]